MSYRGGGVAEILETPENYQSDFKQCEMPYKYAVVVLYDRFLLHANRCYFNGNNQGPIRLIGA